MRPSLFSRPGSSPAALLLVSALFPVSASLPVSAFWLLAMAEGQSSCGFPLLMLPLDEVSIDHVPIPNFITEVISKVFFLFVYYSHRERWSEELCGDMPVSLLRTKLPVSCVPHFRGRSQKYPLTSALKQSSRWRRGSHFIATPTIPSGQQACAGGNFSYEGFNESCNLSLS